MMTEAEIVRLIKQVVRVELSQTMGAAIIDTDDSYTCSLSRFESDSQMDDIRLMRPYGFASRPPEDTPTLVHAINADPSHLLSLTDFDDGNRPDLGNGESALYGSTGQVVLTNGTDVLITDYVPDTGVVLPINRAAFHEDGSFEIGQLEVVNGNAAGEVFLGSTDADNPLVLGDILQSFCDQLLTILTNALTALQSGPIAITSTPGNPAPTSPQIVTAMTTALSSISTLKSTLVDSAATNFLSQTTFTERGL